MHPLLLSSADVIQHFDGTERIAMKKSFLLATLLCSLSNFASEVVARAVTVS